MSSASGSGGGPRNPKFSRLHLTDAEWDGDEHQQGLIYDEGIHRPDGRTTRTRRGSIVFHTANKDGTHTVDILHSERTRAQIAHQEATEQELASGSMTARSAAKTKAQLKEYQSPSFPTTHTGHIAAVERFSWSREHGFVELGGEQHKSGKADKPFTSAENAWLDRAGWPGDRHEERSHSEPRYAMFVERMEKARAAAVAAHSMVGGHDMCRTCQGGLSKTAATAESPPLNYVGSDAFHSQGEWRKAADAHFIQVPNSSITRMRPEDMMTSKLKQDHVDWATKVRAIKSGTKS